jgi:hypothetical protein
MTICTSVKVRDGLVLGTDSMTQIIGQDDAGNRGFIKAYSNAHKLFQIKEWPVGVMTYGIGNLGQRSIQGLVLEFSSNYDDDCNVENISGELLNFFKEAYNEQFGDGGQNEPLGFFVAGYTTDEPFPEEWEFKLPEDNDIKLVRPSDSFGSSWRGVPIPFTRLYKGFDPRMKMEFQKHDVSDEIIEDVFNKFSSPVVYDGMPVQDAVNFASFILRTTIGMSTFEVGVPSCGGPLQVATILPTIGFHWVAKPEISVVL